MDSSQAHLSNPEPLFEDWDSSLSYRRNDHNDLQTSFLDDASSFGQHDVSPGPHLPSSIISWDSSHDTSFFGGSDGCLNSHSADVSTSSFSAYDILSQYDSINPALPLFPDRLTDDPLELQLDGASASRQAGSQSLPNYPSQSQAPSLPRRPCSNDEWRWRANQGYQFPVAIPSPAGLDGTEPSNLLTPRPPKSPATLSHEAEEKQHECPHCGFCPTGQKPRDLLRIHVLRQHKSSDIECDEDGCNVVIANGRKDNLWKHKGTRNCAGFRRRQRWQEELNGQPYPPTFLRHSEGLVSHQTIPPAPTNAMVVQDFLEDYHEIDASLVNEVASGGPGVNYR
ncbi:hypothetical protein QBC34DRAFT_27694 [Podospora aff. communis PSN243]|uniref:C2H2-type domain-containing protein n=1 Tax=Podospora aff. communis PSN243 TaxID=3040156 RepID=A0AAV9GXA1_9PEZI|nr:hypothetical protein QBC34DRAFT_27694 [Podospora aff. communis PSN243]